MGCRGDATGQGRQVKPPTPGTFKTSSSSKIGQLNHPTKREKSGGGGDRSGDELATAVEGMGKILKESILGLTGGVGGITANVTPVPVRGGGTQSALPTRATIENVIVPNILSTLEGESTIGGYEKRYSMEGVSSSLGFDETDLVLEESLSELFTLLVNKYYTTVDLATYLEGKGLNARKAGKVATFIGKHI